MTIPFDTVFSRYTTGIAPTHTLLLCVVHNWCDGCTASDTHTGFPQKLALGLSVGKGLLHQINLTIFIRPWSCQRGNGLISGVSINTHYALKMPNLNIFMTQVNIVMC